MAARVSSARFSTQDSRDQLGLLKHLEGDWKGTGFNLIARPNFHDKQNLYLQLNQTTEKLTLTGIGSPVPNRGFGQDDIQLYGLTYLQKISDAGHDGALHIEPGIWVTQPDTDFPDLKGPRPNKQLIARMATIPHGNAVLATGTAETFVGKPTLSGATPYNGSVFPSFNSTPFAVPPTAPAVFNADGTSEKLSVVNIPGKPAPFDEYDVTIAASAKNPRTPFDTTPPEPPLPTSIHGVPMQDIINDPIRLLQAKVTQQIDQGWQFEDGVVLNVATTTPLTFLTTKNGAPTGPVTTVALPQFGGGPENIQFLEGVTTGTAPNARLLENAQTAIVYATFWIEHLVHGVSKQKLTQLQYAQMVVLNFPVFLALNPPVTTPPTAPLYVNLGWPHITVGTLHRNFG